MAQHRVWIASIVVLVGGCYEEALLHCGDRICPITQRCEQNVCVSDEQLTACNGKEEQSLCSYDERDGVCRNGTCVTPRCGDLVRDPAEQCDDGNHVSGDGCSSDCTGRFAQMEPPIAWDLVDVHAVSEQEAYAMSDKHLIAYDGATWREEFFPITAQMFIRSVWATPGNVWIAGDDSSPLGLAFGFFVNINNGTVMQYSTQGSIGVVWGRSPSDVYGFGTNDIFHYDGANVTAYPPCDDLGHEWRAATGTDTEIFVAGSAGICRGTRDSMSLFSSVAATRLALRGDMLYVLDDVTATGTYSIRMFSLATNNFVDTLRVPADLEDITVLDDGVILGVGRGGTIMEYQPSTQAWTRIVTPTSASLNAIAEATGLFIVGDIGTILH